MDCLEYPDSNELFGELVNDIGHIGGSCEIVPGEIVDGIIPKTDEEEEPGAWVSVFVPVSSLQKHLVKSQNVSW